MYSGFKTGTMFGSADRKLYIKTIRNPLTESIPPITAVISLSVGLDSALENVVLHPQTRIKCKSEKGKGFFFNPFKKAGRTLKEEQAMLCVSSVYMVYQRSDLHVPFTLHLDKFFSTVDPDRANMPKVVRDDPKEKAENGDNNTNEEEVPLNQVMTKKSPEVTNRLSVALDPNRICVFTTENARLIYKSIVPREKHETHGGFDHLYQAEISDTRVVPVDRDGESSNADFIILDDDHPMLADIENLYDDLEIKSNSIVQIEVDNKKKYKIQKTLANQVKDFMRNTIFEYIRYTSFSETTLKSQDIDPSLQEELNKKFLPMLKKRGITGYIPGVEVVLQINATKILNGRARNEVNTLIIKPE